MDALRLARLGLTLRGFLATRLDLETARAQLRRRMETRDERFLQTVSSVSRAGPYAELLRWAGCAPGDLERAVHADGVEKTLEHLRDAGVYVTYQEFRGRVPIVRKGLEIPVRPGAFDNPLVRAGAMGGTTSGSSSAPRPVLVSWASLAEEAAENLLLHEIHGLTRLPFAMWLAPPPGVAAVSCLMVNARRGHPPERWFSPVEGDLPGTAFGARFVTRALPLVGRTAGLRIPRPETVRIGEEAALAGWVAAAIAREGSCVLRTSASGAVRVAEAAIRHGIDVSGGVMLVAGEPLTPPRLRAIEAAGLRAVPHYGTAEAGVIAGGCGEPEACDDMHLYLDRLAGIVLTREMGPGLPAVDSLLLTSLSVGRGQILLNAEIGDHARFERRTCACAFGDLGLDLHLSTVRSHDKLTGSGMALLGGEFVEAVTACVERAGGGPNDFQFWERADGDAATRLVLAVSPELPIDEATFVPAVLEELRLRATGGALVAGMWAAAETLELVRGRPELGAALKTAPFVPSVGA